MTISDSDINLMGMGKDLGRKDVASKFLKMLSTPFNNTAAGSKQDLY